MKKTVFCFFLIIALLLPMGACGNSSDGRFPEELSLDTLYPILNEGRATLVSSTAEGQSGETAEKLFDGNLSTKLCTNVEDYVITWKMNRAYAVAGYTITTANDSEENGRLPRGWTLEVSNDGANWLMVSNIIGSRLERVNFTDYFYKFSQPGEYQYFRFTLTDAGSTRRRMTQMAEITLYGPDRVEAEEEKDFSDNTYAEVGIELLKTMIADYYDDEANVVFAERGHGDVADIRGVAAFLEALAEGYRVCPEDSLIYNTYVDVLNFALTTYRAERTIETFNGSKNVVFYNTTRRGSDDFRYDYNAWICIQYLNAYNLLGDAAYLRRAEDLLDFLWTGWDENRLDGGIYTDWSFEYKSTVSNATTAVAFLSACEITGFSDYLTKGQKIYEWCRSALLEDNLYCESVSRRGSLNDFKGAGNQGTMLVAGSLLYQLTGEERYLQETSTLYKATMDFMFDLKASNISLNGNAIDHATSLSWLERGFILFQSISENNNLLGTEYLNRRFQLNLRTKDGNGYYDPYFKTENRGNQSVRAVMYPSGVASAYLLAALYSAN